MKKYYTDPILVLSFVMFISSLSLLVYRNNLINKLWDKYFYKAPNAVVNVATNSPANSIGATQSAPQAIPVVPTSPLYNTSVNSMVVSNTLNSGLVLQKIRPKTPGVFVVAKDGTGDSADLALVLSQIQTADKIILKEGSYNLPNTLWHLPNFEITGEGEKSIIHTFDAIYSDGQKYKFSKLKIMNRGPMPAFSIGQNGALILDNVDIEGTNENSGVRIRAGHFEAINVTIEKVFSGIQLENPLSVSMTNVTINRANLALMYRSDENAWIKNLNCNSIRKNSIFFDEKYSGKITCVRCYLANPKTNHLDQLIEEN